MELIEKASITLLVQGAKKIFCYFEIPQKIKDKFDEIYGEEFWKKSKPLLKVFQVSNEKIEEIKKIYVDKLADNWYIELENDNMQIYVELGREHLNGMYISLAKSNNVYTPSETQSSVKSNSYVDLSSGDSIDTIENDEISLDLDSNGNRYQLGSEYADKDIEELKSIIIEDLSQSTEKQELDDFDNSDREPYEFIDKRIKSKQHKLIDKDEVGNTQFFDEYFERMKKYLKVSSSK
jgi:hypothetical protein